jgi:VanZ family protein
MTKRNLFILLSIYFCSLFILSLLPINTKGELNHITILKIRGDYFFHMLLFIPAVAFIWLFNLDNGKRINFILLILLCVFIAMVTEGVQYFVPYRAFNINDMIANLAGVLLGSLVILKRRQVPAV